MIGTLLGNRYELLEKIGEGGTAVVYKAKCHLLNRYVSIKILKDEYTKDNEFVEKFKREATAAASFSHNNIVNIYDVGTQGNIQYIVMEYVSGKTLKEIIIENRRLDYNRAVDIGIQIAKALECAHRNNIIHRDIKPQNILVTDDGVVKVTDFGIAKALNSVTITNSSKVMGSAHYFSPEQAKGTFVDYRTDIYSLGVVLYEMVTGKVPYDAESPVSVALKHIQEPVIPPRQINNNVPESLSKLIIKAMEKDPIRRYQNVKDLLLDLHKIKNDAECDILTNNVDDDYTRVMDPITAQSVRNLDRNKEVPKDKTVNKAKYNNPAKDEEFDEVDFDDDDDDDDYEDEKPNSKKDKNKIKKGIIIAAIGILVIAIGAISAAFLLNRPGSTNPANNGKETTIPQIKGLSKDAAKKLVEEKNLNFVLADEEKSDKPAGTVISCSPDEGTNVKVNSDVRVIVSSGSNQTGVPNVKEVDLNTAKDIITNSSFQVGTIQYAYNDSIPSGSVISQDPDVDSNAPSNSSINLVVSKGPNAKYTTVPELRGKTLDEAFSLLSDAKLKLGNRTIIDTTDINLDGKIVNQSISPNASKIKEGTSIDISYYKYREAASINIPALLGSIHLNK